MLDTLDTRVGDALRRARIPGLALALVRGDEVLTARGYGVTAIDAAGIPVTPDTLFAIGSLSKTLTGMAILRLVEDGHLELDRPIADVFPSLRFSRPDAEQQITLRLLLSHTSGLRPRHEPSSPTLSRDLDGLARFVHETIPRLAFVSAPGQVFAYSNPGLNLAGAVAEAMTGALFPTLMHKTLFAPLGLTHTVYDRQVAMTYPIALPHETCEDGALAVTRFFQGNTAGNPASHALSTASDLARVALCHLNFGFVDGRQVLASGSLVAMHTPHADLLSYPGRTYGLTLWIDPHIHGARIGHGGAVMSFSSHLTLVPDARIGVVLLANRLDFGDSTLNNLVSELLDGLSELRPGQPGMSLAQSESEVPTGIFWSYMDGVVRIEEMEGEPLLVWNGNPAPLIPIGGGRYSGWEGRLTAGFAHTATGEVSHLLLGLPGWSIPFERIDPLYQPDRTRWQSYAGSYILRDPGGDERVRVRFVDGALVFAPDWDASEAVGVPVREDAFATRFGLFAFALDTALRGGLWLSNEYIFEREGDE